MDTCVNHPVKQAVARCKRCHAAVCADCRVKVSDGVYCSDECVEEFRRFQSVVHTTPVRRRSRFSIFGALRTLVISAVLLAIIWFVLTTWLGTSDFREMGQRLREILRLLF